MEKKAEKILLCCGERSSIAIGPIIKINRDKVCVWNCSLFVLKASHQPFRETFLTENLNTKVLTPT